MQFYAEADKVLIGMDRLSEAARQIRTAQAGRLIIASHPSAAISLLPALISGFVAERPGVHVRLLSRSSDVIGRLLPSESYDIGIAELPVDEAVVRLTRFRVRCVAILPSTHALASYPTLSPVALSGQPAVALARTLQTSARVALAFAEVGAEWVPVVEAEYSASVCGLVASGAGWSVVDPLSASTFRHLGLVTRPFEPAVYYEIGAFCARNRNPSILAQSFLSMLVDKLGPLYT
jgi:DNA-binding transcriptional LysR family regulator